MKVDYIQNTPEEVRSHTIEYWSGNKKLPKKGSILDTVKALRPALEPMLKKLINENKVTTIKIILTVLFITYVIVCGIIFNYHLISNLWN